MAGAIAMVASAARTPAPRSDNPRRTFSRQFTIGWRHRQVVCVETIDTPAHWSRRAPEPLYPAVKTGLYGPVGRMPVNIVGRGQYQAD